MDESMNRSQDQEPPPHRRVKPPENGQNHHRQQPPPPEKCPRCDSANTKFCYYNNYSLSQPRYFCKGCRRYWTHGGTLRNVPIGGGCRKSKLPKISAPSSSTSEIGRTEALPAPSHFTGMVSGQGLRSGLDPGMGNNSFYTGGALLSSLASLQSLPAGTNQPPVVSLAGGGGGRFGANVALLQGMNLWRPQQPQQFNNNGIFQSPMSSWTQGFVYRGGGATTSAGSGGSFWSGAAVDGGNQVGSSFNPNQWSSDANNHHGYNPSL